MRFPLLFIATVLFSAENTVSTIEWKDLPAAVQVAAKRQKTAPGDLISYVKLLRRGEVRFEMKVNRKDGRDREILFRPDGSVVEVEETVALDSVPEKVRSAIEQAARAGKLLKVDQIHRDRQTLYEGEILENGAKIKPIFDAAGRRVE